MSADVRARSCGSSHRVLSGQGRYRLAVIWAPRRSRTGREAILSPRRYNGRVGLALCCPITTQVKGYPFEVTIPEDFAVSGVALSDQLRTLDWKACGAEYACGVPMETVTEALAKARTLID